MPSVIEVPLRWSDMDAYAHVNNVQYLRLLEDARVTGFRQWFDADGHDGLLAGGIVVTRHEIEYQTPLVHRHGPVAVEMWVTGVAAASFDLGYLIRDPEGLGSNLYAVAATGLALFDLASERPRRLTPDQRDVLRSHLADPVTFRWRR